MQSVILAGRGPSVYDFEWPEGVDVMAVSSGIFGLPEGMLPKHFVTMDSPKYFMCGLMPGVSIAWQEDERAHHWPFWREPDIVKHILKGRDKPGHYRLVPPDVLDYVPDKWKEVARQALYDGNHELGFQPQWGDYPNRRGWLLNSAKGPNFLGEGELGLDNLRNTLLMAVQVAAQIGYQRCYFIGCDLAEKFYDPTRETLLRWKPIAEEHGLEWINLAPSSSLAQIMPTQLGAVAA